jgi:hypothetical protein
VRALTGTLDTTSASATGKARKNRIGLRSDCRGADTRAPGQALRARSEPVHRSAWHSSDGSGCPRLASDESKRRPIPTSYCDAGRRTACTGFLRPLVSAADIFDSMPILHATAARRRGDRATKRHQPRNQRNHCGNWSKQGMLIPEYKLAIVEQTCRAP